MTTTNNTSNILTSELAASSPGRMSPIQNLKADLQVERPASPETNCAICLEELRNKSFTNTCLHQFCFHCLLEWSKVKPECPLCKQAFTRIYHNIRPNEEYDEHVLEPQPLPPPTIDPHIFINVAFQRHRFRYRSTSTMGGGSMVWAFPGIDPLSLSPWSSSNHEFPIDYSTSGSVGINRPARSGATTTRALTRIQQRLDSSAFRRNVYRQGLWVRPGTAARFRECSPEFYRRNPAQTHRLVPWLTRELNVLLDMQYDTQTVCQDILSLIASHHINSSVFHRAMTFYLGRTAEHFIHEFYHFAISPHDMTAYDSHAQYAQVGREFSSESDSDIELLSSMPPLISLDLTTAPGPSGLQQPSTSSASAPFPSATPITETIEHSDNSSDCVIISDGEDSRNGEPDSDVEIIGQLPPRHLRTPEVITIDSDSDETIDMSVQPKREPLVDYDILSSGEGEENVANRNYIPQQPPFSPSAPCQCPLYDNCPYSREIAARMKQKQTKVEPIQLTSESCSSSSTSSNTGSSYSTTEDVDDSEVSSNGRGSSRRHKHKKSTNLRNNDYHKKKKKLRKSSSSCNSGRCHRSLKRKYSRDESNRSNQHRHGQQHSDDSSMYNSDSNNNNNNNNNNNDSSSDDSNNCIDRKRKRSQPTRLRSIVLKVNQSNKTPSTSNINKTIVMYSRTTVRMSSSDSDD
ncbi:hypothetical protein O3M35_013273 [Rhynocoris fuscipes]|uniref:E3 ubiquitin-protein ligase Topors n=1 Tax=Rhynocoris fuscipes TaxID=488301 RepID=A0AAW1CET3_9HEMI